MSHTFRYDYQWVLRLVAKILGWILVLNLIILPVLWFLKIFHMFTLALVYEALFISIIGVLQILSSYIYRENSIPSRYVGRTGWLDFRGFAELKPKQRHRYRQEGKITLILGLILLVVTILTHLSVSP